MRFDHNANLYQSLDMMQHDTDLTSKYYSRLMKHIDVCSKLRVAHTNSGIASQIYLICITPINCLIYPEL